MSRFFRIAFALVSIAYAGANMAQAAQKEQSGTQAKLLTFGRNTDLDHGLAFACDVWGQAARSHRPGCDEALYANNGGTGSDG
jgi:hypothetical protein